MQNPYWHDKFKPHLVDRDEIHQLCFELFSIIRASSTQQGAGIEYVDPDEAPDFTSLDQLFFRMAEAQLSKRLLSLALLVRTFDDTMRGTDDPTPYETHRVRIDREQGPFGHVFEGNPHITETIRECSNKIIHAEDVRPVYDSDDDRKDPKATWGMTGVIELEGMQGAKKWAIDIYLPDYLEGLLELIRFDEPCASSFPSNMR